MPVTMEINDLSNKELAQQYVNDGEMVKLQLSNSLGTLRLLRNMHYYSKDTSKYNAWEAS